jgi:predicted nuclease with RNAse H fold
LRYFGIAFGSGDYAYACALEEVRTLEPPVRLRCAFYEPGSVDQVAAEVRAAGDEAVAAIGAPMSAAPDGRESRECDAGLLLRGVMPLPYSEQGRALFRALSTRGLFEPAAAEGVTAGEVPDGAFREAPVFETHPDGIFCALQGQRMPAKRHPLGVQRRIDELVADELLDESGGFWNRRIEEIDAAAAALAAHRYAVGHACWVGDPAEGVIVLPGSRLPEKFSGEGVIPPVPRVPLPPPA